MSGSVRALAAVTVFLLAAPTSAGEPPYAGPAFYSPHAGPIATFGDRVYVANTPAGTLDVIDADARAVVARVRVGVEPVGVGVRPDGREAWVSNQVSDSVSVVDLDPASPTHLCAVATVQEFDADRCSTRFDEPAGIAFAGVDKAYVALSSENEVAVIDVATRRVTKRLTIPAQDPRAIRVRGGRLYVLPFESHNKTQLSGGRGDALDGDLATFDAWEHSIVHNNVLSLGHVVDVVKHPDFPDRDLFVFDTRTDELVETVDSLGTLLYGLAVGSDGTAYVAQTDARNDANGRSGTKKHGLGELANRAFLNRVTRVPIGGAATPSFFDLEPLPPENPAPGEALATPYAVEITADDRTLVATAAGSDAVFTLDAETGELLGRADVGSVPRGVALQEDGDAAAAWVLNAVANTVSRVDLADRSAPRVTDTVVLSDPTPPALKRGRAAFETASASSTGTFSCASCHPDGHTDQLLWVLSTPVVSGGDQVMPRSTMPLRGLRDTEPFHWDGIPGDPYGGNNSGNVHGRDEPNVPAGDSHAAVRHLIDGGAASTMMLSGDPFQNDEHLAGRLTKAERDDLATFLLSIPYPPAQRRPYTNAVSDRAKDGFRLFHVEGDEDPSKPGPNVCGDCHRMPHLVSTNTPGTGMDAPTWRGAYDRFLILPQGRLNLMQFGFFARVADRGTPEEEVWRFSWGGRPRFDPVWDMVLEMSTGHPGAFARQVTLGGSTAGDESTRDLLAALETAAADGSVVLAGEGVDLRGDEAVPLRLRFGGEGVYVDPEAGVMISTEDLLREAAAGRVLVTLTAGLGEAASADAPQPAVWTPGPIERQSGRQKFPRLAPGETAFTVSGRHVDPDARVFLDGRRVGGVVTPQEGERVRVALDEQPAEGLHLLRLQNPGGLMSNDFLLTSVDAADAPEPPKPTTVAAALEAAGWSALIGRWVDEGSGGEGLTLNVRWRAGGRVLEFESVDPARTSVALISVNAANGDVFQVGADSTGASHLGTWAFERGGDATLDLGYTGGDGSQGRLVVRYRMPDEDTLVMTQPLRVVLKRAADGGGANGPR